MYGEHNIWGQTNVSLFIVCIPICTCLDSISFHVLLTVHRDISVQHKPT